MKIQESNKIIPKNIKIAHRGLWNKKFPENSLSAFKNSIENNTPIELDVHILKDGNLVVFHDDNLKRMCGIDKDIKDLDYLELKELKLKDTNEPIPLFSDVLKLIDGQVLIDIELKTDVKNFKICNSVCKLLDNYNGDFFIKSFNPLYIIWLRFHRKNYIRGLLVSELKNVSISKVTKLICKNMWLNFLCKPDFIAVDKNFLKNQKIIKLQKKGVPLFVWTIRENENLYNNYNGIIYEDAN